MTTSQPTDRESLDIQDRATGCLAGLLIGDALGGQVEFQTREQIARSHPDGVRELEDGGHWNTIAGQPTDDGEMALALSRSIIAGGGYDAGLVREAYVGWLDSDPFDIGSTTIRGLTGRPNHDSQANGALMRCAPLAIYAAGRRVLSFEFASDDAMITHPNPVPVTANRFYVELITRTIRQGEPENRVDLAREVLTDLSREVSGRQEAFNTVEKIVNAAFDRKPEDYSHQMGWVLIALQNAIHQWLHASDFETALVDTISEGGDTDTNAAICGSLLGACCGANGIPRRWLDVLQNCRADANTEKPRPEMLWPNDFQDLAFGLLKAGD